MFGFDVGCGWVGMVCGVDFRSFGCAQDDMVCIWVALTPGPCTIGRGGMSFDKLRTNGGEVSMKGALTPGPSPIGRGENFGIDVGCGGWTWYVVWI